MCGIFGICHKDENATINEQFLQQSANLIQHRGPDGHGIYVGRGLGFVHTRLSLLDLEARSDQPFWDNTGRYCLVYNGEVYNYQLLRKELEQKGYKFKTSSDTEVILYSLIQYGTDAFSTFEGMFALCFYDKEKGTVILARDRFGIKPLYLYTDNDAILFSSEIKALQPWAKLEPDTLSISSYLMGYGGPNASFTFYNKLKVMPTGTYLKIESGKIVSQARFFEIENFLDEDEFIRLQKSSKTDIIDEAEQLLIDSVNKHMIADIPVGALCSGGVDSSLIMALASKTNKNLAIFHADVKGPLSEYDAAARLARHLDLEMKVVDVNDYDFLERMPQVTEHFGQPFLYHPNSIPFLMVCDLVHSNHVKAILTGEAADEGFLGYSSIPTEDIFLKYYAGLKRLRSLTHKIPAIGERLWPTDNNQANCIQSIHNRFEIEEEKGNPLDYYLQKYDKGTAKTIKHLKYHLRTLLHRNDCLGMASSIEARFPFLDHDLIRFSINLPYKNKIHFSADRPIEKKHPFMKNKWVIRQVANRYLPTDLSQRPKQGFPTNTFERMNISSDYFQNSYVKDFFELSSNQVKLLDSQCNRHIKMRLLHLDIWGKICHLQEKKDTVVTHLKNNVTITPL